MIPTTLTKRALASKISDVTGITASLATTILDAMVSVVSRHFESGGEVVTIRGFGTFSRSVRGAYTTKRPDTGEEIQIPIHKSIKFKPSRDLVARLNS